MVTRKTWQDFRDTGLLMLANQFLHIFGWAIVVDLDDSGEILEVYPARVKFRGFGEESQSKAYKNISKYMVENSEELLKEAKE